MKRDKSINFKPIQVVLLSNSRKIIYKSLGTKIHNRQYYYSKYKTSTKSDILISWTVVKLNLKTLHSFHDINIYILIIRPD